MPGNSTLEAEGWTVGMESAPSAFDQTTQNLLRLGSLTMDKFAQDPSEELDGFDIPLVNLTNPNGAGHYLGDTTASRNPDTGVGDSNEIPIVPPDEAMRFLRDAAQREFGITKFEPLQYEFLEELGQDRKCCILTISRPNGISRSYRTKAEFSRKSEAKIAAACSAIQLGAVNFIKHGETSGATGKRSLVLAKLDAGMKKSEAEATDQSIAEGEGYSGGESNTDWAVIEIEKCCVEWRGGEVVPQWFYLVDQKFSDAYGCALKIALTPHLQRTYSVSVSSDYRKKSLAKAGCAKLALEQDVLNFIKHGDGLAQPIVVPFVGAEAMPPPAPPSATTIQAFFAALPKPMPDHIGTKNNGEINAVAWLNNMVQVAKGSRMVVTYHWHTNTKLGLHGCLLRLTRPDAPSQSYLVDALFSKRSDAKVAVCLFACSQGLGDYVRTVAAEIEARVSPTMRRRCAEQILPGLGQALNKVRHGLRPHFTYDSDLATFGCTLTIDLSPDSDSDASNKKQWQVPLAYKSKMDARIAVVCAAADDGLMDFIKCSGKSPTGEELAKVNEPMDAAGEDELEEGETIVEREKKKTKKKLKGDKVVEDEADSQMMSPDGNVPLFETKEAARARGKFDGATTAKRRQRNFNGRGRGTSYGRPLSRGGFGPTGFRGSYAPARHRAVSGPGGFPAPYPHIHPLLPPFQSPMAFHPLGGPAHFHHPHPFVPAAGGFGFAGGTYPIGYEYRDRNPFLADPGTAHRRLTHGFGRPGAHTATSFAPAPLPASSPVTPHFHGYYDRGHDYGFIRAREHREGLHAQPHYSDSVPPAGSSAFPGVPPRYYNYDYAPERSHPPPPSVSYANNHAMRAEYSYENDEYVGRPAQSFSRAYEPGPYAPDYDRIPDRDAANHGVSAESYPPAHPSGQEASLRRFSAMSLRPGLPTPFPPAHSLASQSHSSHSHSHLPVAVLSPSSQNTPSHGDDMRASDHAPPGTDRPARDLVHPPAEANASKDGGIPGYNRYRDPSRGGRLHPNSPPGSPRAEEQGRASLGEKPGSTTSRVEQETNAKTIGHRPRWVPNEKDGGLELSSGRKRSLSDSQKSHESDMDISASERSVNIPAKRGRSYDWEESLSRKRAHRSSQSISPDPVRNGPQDERADRSITPSGLEDSTPSEEREPGPLKFVSQVPDLGENENGVTSPNGASEKSPGDQKRKRSGQRDKSYVTALLDHCLKEGLPCPELCHEELISDSNETSRAFKVWIVMGKERLELPMSFPTLNAGQERVAKSVLGRLKLQIKKRRDV